jgi:NAD-dependent SIR2 family protein deacetylase
MTPAPTADLDRLEYFVRRHPRLLVLTGAGISIGSGIPAYRDQNGSWLRSDPIQHQAFLDDPFARRRYWARSFSGWPGVAAARPNAAHHALARLERTGHLQLLITQNVDRLHQRAGSRRVVDLHGRLDRVTCLACGRHSSRRAMQHRLAAANPQLAGVTAVLAPDGDAPVDDALAPGVTVPDCVQCGGILMPDVVFFGGTVPNTRVERCMRALEAADALLAIGSSLQVFSGFRFCRAAVAGGKPVAIINPGRTRADELASLRIAAPCERLLEALGQRLDSRNAGASSAPLTRLDPTAAR